MAIFCPVLKRKVVYLTCQECEDKLCRKEKESEAIKQTESKNTMKNSFSRKQL